MKFVVNAGGQLNGHIRVPGDKSISHRAIMLGSLAQGTTHVSGFLEGEDTLATLAAFRSMGINIAQPEAGIVSIEGKGLQGLRPATQPLDLGNSGTAMRLMTGVMAGQSFDSVLIGDESLSRRPMRRVTEPLAKMGAKIKTNAEGTPPLHVLGQQKLRGIEYAMPIASAQVKSCLLLAGLYAQGETCVKEPAPTRDHTERMLNGFGYPIQRDATTVCLAGGGQLTATPIDVPADISSAAFFMVGASIAEHSEIVLQHVGINPTRTGVIEILRLMGADLTVENRREIGGEPVADIRVRSAELRGIDIPEELVPLAIDEFPVLFIAAACAKGKTLLTGASELRVKESDRIQVMAEGLQALGITAEPTPDGMIIEGGQLQGGNIHSEGDHRIAMAFSIAALKAKAAIEIMDCAKVATSFPNFVELAQASGIRLAVEA